MWQRIQTVFLAFGALGLLAALILPLWEAGTGMEKVVLTPFYFLQKNEYVYFPYSLTAVLIIAGISLLILSIRRFDNRILQMRLGLLNTLILTGVMTCIVIFVIKLNKQFPGAQNGIGLYFVFGAVICNWLALRFIRRDEKLVRDSERLR